MGIRATILFSMTIFLSACTREPVLPGLVDSARLFEEQRAERAVYRVATDEDLLAQTLIIANRKGTLARALSKAAADTIVGIRMRETLLLRDTQQTAGARSQ